MHLTIGTRVSVHGDSGTVKYLGGTEFQPGEWVGVELDTPNGKNNGIVKGVKYFECRQSGGRLYGLFVRPSLVHVIKSVQSTVGEPRGEGPKDLDTHIGELKSAHEELSKQKTQDDDLLEQLVEERKKGLRLENVIQRLELKLAPMRRELNSLREELKLRENESHDEDANELIEVLTLDKEMAEERCESLTIDLENLRKQIEELQLECQVLKEEKDLYLGNTVANDTVDNIKLQHKVDQMEGALLKLRDICVSQEAASKEEIQSLKGQLAQLKNADATVSKMQIKISELEDIIADLKSQLDNALGAEEMIENLTEKNLALGEKCNEFEKTIKELETLKELNDELEVAQAQKELQLIEQIESLQRSAKYTETQLTDCKSRNTQLEEIVRSLRDTLKDPVSVAMPVPLSAPLPTRENHSLRTLEQQLKQSTLESVISELNIAKEYLPTEYKVRSTGIEACISLETISKVSQHMLEYFESNIEHLTGFGVCQDLISIVSLSDSIHRGIYKMSLDELGKKDEILKGVKSLREDLMTNGQSLANGSIRYDVLTGHVHGIVLSLKRISKDVGNEINGAKEAMHTMTLVKAIWKHLPITLDASQLDTLDFADTEMDEYPEFKRLLQESIDLLRCEPDLMLSMYSEKAGRQFESMEELKDWFQAALDRIAALPTRPLQQSSAPWQINTFSVKLLEQENQKLLLDIAKLTEERQSLAASLKTKNKSLEELELKVDLLTAKASGAKEQESIIIDLRSLINTSEAQVKSLHQQVKQLEGVIEAQNKSLTRLKQIASIAGFDDDDTVIPLSGMSGLSLHTEVQSLRRTIERLNHENSLLKQGDFLKLDKLTYKTYPRDRSHLRTRVGAFLDELKKAAPFYECIHLEIPKRNNKALINYYSQVECQKSLDQLFFQSVAGE